MTSTAAVSALTGVTLALMASAVPLHAEPLAPAQVVTVEVRRGVTVKYLALAKPNVTPRAAVILFAGGNGLLSLAPDGAIGTNLAGNFLVRSRGRFVQHDFFVAVVDTPNQVPIDGNVRLSPEYATDIGLVIEDVRGRIAAGSKVWLVGTSSGTISAASVAARLAGANRGGGRRRPDGVVLTATQTTMVRGYCGRTVFNAALAAIDVPVLVASHTADGCGCSPASTAAQVIAAVKRAPVKYNIAFSGGAPAKSKDPCMAMTPHGFLGLEDKVVAAVADWIRSH